MARPRSQLRLLLIQVRDHPGALAQEQRCFLDRCRLAPEQMRVHNLIAEPSIAWRTVGDADVVMIGGAGSHSVTRSEPFDAPLADLVLQLLDEERPLFGSCWGHQFMARALGGTVITDREKSEVGTFEIALTDAGRRDPLCAGYPERFPVQLGHNDRIDRAPVGIEVLATSERCAHQVIRVRDKPAYGSQFHSEMTDDDMRRRVAMYSSEYLGDGADAAARFEERLSPSPDADRLLDRFLEVYV